MTTPVPTILWFLASLHGDQFSVTTDLSREECANRLSASQKAICVPYIPKTEGMIMVYQLDGRIRLSPYGVSVPFAKETCHLFISDLDSSVPATCVPVPLAHEECLAR
jgi:hypothetical protein